MRLNDRARRWLPWGLLALAAVATAAVYWPGLTGGWVFDDYPNIVDNAAIHITHGHATLTAWVNAAMSSPASFLHRPLASITFALNWMAGGGDPWPFKVTNIIIHLINGALLFCMLRVLLRLLGLRQCVLLPSPIGRGTGSEGPVLAPNLIPRGTKPSPTPSGHPLPPGGGTSNCIDDAAATRLALIVSAAWMLLPINLMAVLYVVQRMESLCQIFVLAGLWAYLHGRWMMLTATDARRDRRGFVLAVAGVALGTLLGLTSKETAVLLPVFAFLAEWILLRFARASITGSWIPGSVFDAAKDGPGITNNTQPTADYSGAAHDVASDGDTAQLYRHSGAVRSTEPGIHASGADTRILWTFVVTLFVPAVLGFLWLLRIALRPSTWSGRDFTLAQRLLTEPRVLVDYLHWTLLPNPMVLSLYHDEIVTSIGLLTPWTTLGAILLLAALIVVAVWLRNRRPLVSLGIGWFFAAQLLTATVVPLELVYEQRMYFASIGVLLAAGALLLGLRWRIALPLLRGFIVAVALLWFAGATNLRAREWSNPLRLAVVEADRHPESARAVYEAGRLLLIASNYQPGKLLDESWKYLRKAAAIPGSSALSDQAMIMIADHHQQGADADYWRSMIRKLRGQPTRQEDISALISLTNCYEAKICKFDTAWLQRAYKAALSRLDPIARLLGAYADFQRDILHDDLQAEKYLALAVAGDPSEPAYRMDLTALYARNGQTGEALKQIAELRRMNLAGRLNGQIATLERLVDAGKSKPRQ